MGAHAYLVEHKLVSAVDQAWEADMTYIPLEKRFLCMDTFEN